MNNAPSPGVREVEGGGLAKAGVAMGLAANLCQLGDQQISRDIREQQYHLLPCWHSQCEIWRLLHFCPPNLAENIFFKRFYSFIREKEREREKQAPC